MASSITETPQSGAEVNKCRVLKERERRARETAAFRNLRHTLELADTQAFWRMEKVDIAEGAVYLIEKMVGDSTKEIPEREPIVFDEEKTVPQEEKLNRVEVEKRRRARESKAVKKLKELLMKHSNDVHAKMDKIDVLNDAASFLKSLALANRTKTGSEGPYSPVSESPFSTPNLSSPSSSDSGNSSLIFEPSPEQNVIASLIQNNALLQINNTLLYPSTAPGTKSIDSSTAEKKHGFHRPWE